MTRLFDRRAQVTIGPSGGLGLVVNQDGLRFAFEVEKSSTSEPNKLTLTLFNLNDASRGLISERDADVVLEAGYRGLVSRIAKAQITDIRQVRQGPDTKVTIECGDGVDAMRDSKATVSFEQGVSIKDMIGQAVDNLGLAAGEIASTISDQFANGFSFSGLTKDLLDKLADATGLEWSVQDGQVQVIERGGATSEPAIKLTPRTGLIGTPTRTDEGWEIKSLLMPISPGRRLEVGSDSLEGVGSLVSMSARTVKIVGDTRGGPWHATTEAVVL